MADLTITAASVIPGTGAVTEDVIAGATVTAGQTVYLDSSDLATNGKGKAKLADANLSAAAAVTRGIALHASLAGQPLKIQTSGQIAIGATVAVGTIYIQSATAGGIAPSTDGATGWYTGIIGIGITAGIIQLNINSGGVAVP